MAVRIFVLSHAALPSANVLQGGKYYIVQTAGPHAVSVLYRLVSGFSEECRSSRQSRTACNAGFFFWLMLLLQSLKLQDSVVADHMRLIVTINDITHIAGEQVWILAEAGVYRLNTLRSTTVVPVWIFVAATHGFSPTSGPHSIEGNAPNNYFTMHVCSVMNLNAGDKVTVGVFSTSTNNFVLQVRGDEIERNG